MKTDKFIEPTGNEIREGTSVIDCIPNADIISMETMVHMMVNKGICTAEELFMLESRVQELNNKGQKNSFVAVHNYQNRGRFPGLKKAMSKHRWSRRLGALLFGWKWKKVKKNQSL